MILWYNNNIPKGGRVMLEVVKNYLLFGVVENIVIFMFLRNVCKVNQVKYRDLIPLSLLFVLFGSITIPFVKQTLGLITLFAYLKIVSKESFIGCLKKSTMSFMYLLCIEMIFSITLELVFKKDASLFCTFDKFMIMIPMRFIEISIVLLYNKMHKEK